MSYVILLVFCRFILIYINFMNLVFTVDTFYEILKNFFYGNGQLFYYILILINKFLKFKIDFKFV